VIFYGDGEPRFDAPIGALYMQALSGGATALHVKQAGGVEGWVAK
jgi:hypothetical protein